MQPIEYELNIWLACGITTIRDVGSDTRRALEPVSYTHLTLPTNREV